MGSCALAVVASATFYLTFLQATFRSDSDFERLARVHWVQAGLVVLLPVSVYLFGFAGLCVHTAVQTVLVTALVLAGPASDGVTEVQDAYHVDRGYPDFVGQLRGLGAHVERTQRPD